MNFKFIYIAPAFYFEMLQFWVEFFKLAKTLYKVRLHVVSFNRLIAALNLEEFAIYLRYCRKLDFFETPNYAYLTKLFQDILDSRGWKCDWDFDWHRLQLTDVGSMFSFS